MLTSTVGRFGDGTLNELLISEAAADQGEKEKGAGGAGGAGWPGWPGSHVITGAID